MQAPFSCLQELKEISCSLKLPERGSPWGSTPKWPWPWQRRAAAPHTALPTGRETLGFFQSKPTKKLSTPCWSGSFPEHSQRMQRALHERAGLGFLIPLSLGAWHHQSPIGGCSSPAGFFPAFLAALLFFSFSPPPHMSKAKAEPCALLHAQTLWDLSKPPALPCGLQWGEDPAAPAFLPGVF